MITEPRKYGYAMQIPCPVRLRVWNDPLGPVNKIIALVREDGTLVASKLHPVPVGAEVRLGYDNSPKITLHDERWNPLCSWGFGYPVWYAEVDGRRILEVPEHETWPPIPPPRRSPCGSACVARGPSSGALTSTG